jgi:hypothetical protein
MLNKVPLVIYKTCPQHASSYFVVSKNLENQVVDLGFTQCLKFIDKLFKMSVMKYRWKVTRDNT